MRIIWMHLWNEYGYHNKHYTKTPPREKNHIWYGYYGKKLDKYNKDNNIQILQKHIMETNKIIVMDCWVENQRFYTDKFNKYNENG